MGKPSYSLLLLLCPNVQLLPWVEFNVTSDSIMKHSSVVTPGSTRCRYNQGEDSRFNTILQYSALYHHELRAVCLLHICSFILSLSTPQSARALRNSYITIRFFHFLGSTQRSLWVWTDKINRHHLIVRPPWTPKEVETMSGDVQIQARDTFLERRVFA